ncbi:hypothetical protein [Komagataeibacter europaeus]|uniref:hypothetical protein n=1 Tax=Komagataeibacter europaeus TaxID=33995 RepID=UPI0018C8C66D|nr:hypothetical protein [Komagataeibacter europaeus]
MNMAAALGQPGNGDRPGSATVSFAFSMSADMAFIGFDLSCRASCLATMSRNLRQSRVAVSRVMPRITAILHANMSATQ